MMEIESWYVWMQCMCYVYKKDDV